MMPPLRFAAVVAALLVSGFTAEHLASRAVPEDHLGADTPGTAPALPAAAAPEPLAPKVSPVLRRRLPMGPVQGPVSSPFGPRVHPVSGRVRHHDGVDLAVPEGTAVWTVAPGTVRSVGPRPGYGLVVEIDHPGGIGGAGQGEPVRTRYAHLASIDAALRPGLRVARGVALGASGGRPGRDGVSTGAHLHFEVRDPSGRPLDPARFVRLPDAASRTPRWGTPATDVWPTSAPRSEPPPRPSPAASAADAEADSLTTAEGDLPDLVLPDYPTLPAISGTP